jgi:hypothetical protein
MKHQQHRKIFKAFEQRRPEMSSSFQIAEKYRPALGEMRNASKDLYYGLWVTDYGEQANRTRLITYLGVGASDPEVPWRRKACFITEYRVELTCPAFC